MKRVACIVFGLVFVLGLTGCDSFVKKFTRKSKKEEVNKPVMVPAPEEYTGQQLSKEELYRKHFLYWKSWQDELIQSLSGSTNQKKQLDCCKQAITNLTRLRRMLDDAHKVKLDIYLNDLQALSDAITRDLYGSHPQDNRITAERLRRDIVRDFSYDEVKGALL